VKYYAIHIQTHLSEARLVCSLGLREAGSKEPVCSLFPILSASPALLMFPGLGNDNPCFIQKDIYLWTTIVFESEETKIPRSQTSVTLLCSHLNIFTKSMMFCTKIAQEQNGQDINSFHL